MGLHSSALATLLIVVASIAPQADAYWCVARSDAGDTALQAGLDYACSAGADCAPLQPTGLCFLPNTLQAHASYAFNSLYQRKNMAPGACDFGGTSILAKTDPSYGSCIYPPNPSTAGLISTQSTTPNESVTPTTNSASGGGGGLSPTTGPAIPTTTNDATHSLRFRVSEVIVSFIALLLVA